MRKADWIGIGVAIALSAAMAIAGSGEKKKCAASTQDCLDAMAAKLETKGLVGVEGEWDDTAKTYLIKSFIAGGQAQTSGLQAGDKMVAINGIKLGDEEGAKRDQANRVPGRVAQVTVLRGDRELSVAVTLMALTHEQIAAAVGEHMLEHVAKR